MKRYNCNRDPPEQQPKAEPSSEYAENFLDCASNVCTRTARLDALNQELGISIKLFQDKTMNPVMFRGLLKQMICTLCNMLKDFDHAVKTRMLYENQIPRNACRNMNYQQPNPRWSRPINVDFWNAGLEDLEPIRTSTITGSLEVHRRFAPTDNKPAVMLVSRTRGNIYMPAERGGGVRDTPPRRCPAKEVAANPVPRPCEENNQTDCPLRNAQYDPYGDDENLRELEAEPSPFCCAVPDFQTTCDSYRYPTCSRVPPKEVSMQGSLDYLDVCPCQEEPQRVCQPCKTAQAPRQQTCGPKTPPCGMPLPKAPPPPPDTRPTEQAPPPPPPKTAPASACPYATAPINRPIEYEEVIRAPIRPRQHQQQQPQPAAAAAAAPVQPPKPAASRCNCQKPVQHSVCQCTPPPEPVKTKSPDGWCTCSGGEKPPTQPTCGPFNRGFRFQPPQRQYQREETEVCALNDMPTQTCVTPRETLSAVTPCANSMIYPSPVQPNNMCNFLNKPKLPCSTANSGQFIYNAPNFGYCSGNTTPGTGLSTDTPDSSSCRSGSSSPCAAQFAESLCSRMVEPNDQFYSLTSTCATKKRGTCTCDGEEYFSLESTDDDLCAAVKPSCSKKLRRKQPKEQPKEQPKAPAAAPKSKQSNMILDLLREVKQLLTQKKPEEPEPVSPCAAAKAEKPVCQSKKPKRSVCPLAKPEEPVCESKKPKRPVCPLAKPEEPVCQSKKPAESVCQSKKPKRPVCPLAKPEPPVCQSKASKYSQQSTCDKPSANQRMPFTTSEIICGSPAISEKSSKISAISETSPICSTMPAVCGSEPKLPPPEPEDEDDCACPLAAPKKKPPVPVMMPPRICQPSSSCEMTCDCESESASCSLPEFEGDFSECSNAFNDTSSRVSNSCQNSDTRVTPSCSSRSALPQTTPCQQATGMQPVPISIFMVPPTADCAGVPNAPFPIFLVANPTALSTAMPAAMPTAIPTQQPPIMPSDTIASLSADMRNLKSDCGAKKPCWSPGSETLHHGIDISSLRDGANSEATMGSEAPCFDSKSISSKTSDSLCIDCGLPQSLCLCKEEIKCTAPMRAAPKKQKKHKPCSSQKPPLCSSPILPTKPTRQSVCRCAEVLRKKLAMTPIAVCTEVEPISAKCVVKSKLTSEQKPEGECEKDCDKEESNETAVAEEIKQEENPCEDESSPCAGIPSLSELLETPIACGDETSPCGAETVATTCEGELSPCEFSAAQSPCGDELSPCEMSAAQTPCDGESSPCGTSSAQTPCDGGLSPCDTSAMQTPCGGELSPCATSASPTPCDSALSPCGGKGESTPSDGAASPIAAAQSPCAAAASPCAAAASPCAAAASPCAAAAPPCAAAAPPCAAAASPCAAAAAPCAAAAAPCAAAASPCAAAAAPCAAATPPCAAAAASPCGDAPCAPCENQNATPSECNCCHCKAERAKKQCEELFPAQTCPPPPPSCPPTDNDLRYFIDSIILDLDAMEHARRQKQAQMTLRPPVRPGLCPKSSFPVTITNVTELGASSLYVKWTIHDCTGIGGYEIYVDGHLTNRYFKCDHEAAVVCDVDVTEPHKLVLLAQPKIGDALDCPQDEFSASRCNKKKPGVASKCGTPPANWSPSIYYYDPACPRKPDCK